MLIVLFGRVSSVRLPGKGFFTFFGNTIWERMCEIAKSVSGAEHIVFATGDDPINLVARPVIEKAGVEFFVGPEENVLERLVRITERHAPDYVCRVTCDNYLIQPELIESIHDAVRAEQSQYGYIAPLSHYAGEIIESQTLLDHFRAGYSDLAREHVTCDIRNDENVAATVLAEDYLGLDHRNSITLDTLDDLILLKNLENRFEGLREVRCVETLRKVHREYLAQENAG